MALGGNYQVEEINARGVEPAIIADPGDGGAIDVSRSGIVEITSAGVETRTLADPVFRGQELAIYMVADGGDCVITAASPVNQTGHTTLTFSAIGGYLLLRSKYNATDGWEWQEIMEDTGATTS